MASLSDSSEMEEEERGVAVGQNRIIKKSKAWNSIGTQILFLNKSWNSVEMSTSFFKLNILPH